MEISSRQKLILLAVIGDYILNVKPVGSKKLINSYGFKCSSATLRNELLCLEKFGYLAQPHTSAGRVPTVKGYRYYVSAIKRTGLSLEEYRTVIDFYADLNREIDNLLQQTTALLSRLTKYVGIVCAPILSRDRIKHIDLVNISSTELLVVLITNSGFVAKDIVKVENYDADVKDVELQLNRHLYDLDLGALESKTINLKAIYGNLFSQISGKVKELLSNQNKQRVYFDGVINLIGIPEFNNQDNVRQFLGFLDDSYKVLGFLEESLSQDVPIVRIGSQNTGYSLEDMSLVASGYEMNGKTIGAVGILGPIRMDYARAISAVQCISSNLSQTLQRHQ